MPDMEGINILTLNCQGLGDKNKRKDVFSYLRCRKYNIACLQDTHFTPEIENMVRAEWGYECHFSSFKSNSRGVAVLFNNNFEYKVLKETKGNDGNFLALDLEIANNKLTLITVYGPNTDSPSFYDKITEVIGLYGNDSFIVCGDFNLVINPQQDCENYRNINNPKAREKILEIMETYSMIDIFREFFPDRKRFSWRRTNPFKQARLDFFLVADKLISSISASDIEPGYRTDHSMPYITLKFNKFKKGRGLWKFNNSLLQDPEYLDTINKLILDIKSQYVLPVYNLENIRDISDSDIQFQINDQLFLETLLIEIRGKTIAYSAYKKKTQIAQENCLIQDISELESCMSDNNIEELINKKQELENLRQKKLKGSIIRSKAKWILEGEKPTKYFLNLENRNFTTKIIPKIVKENGEEIYNQDDILYEISNFYKHLYSTSDSVVQDDYDLNEYLKNIEVPKLSDLQAQKLEGQITYSEASETLNKMKNNKSPGSDGFTVEFLKVFWKKLGHFIVRSINFGFLNKELSITQKQGIITCLPKGDKPRQFMKNWRPITLLNNIYKIASASIANRLKQILNKLISSDQTGFIQGRYIGENTRLIYDIMQYAEENDIPGLLLMIDFEKAFDSVSWTFMEKVFEYFNFGADIQKWIKVLHRKPISAVNQGGNLSEFFEIKNGCRQGDPIAPYIFVLCAEILAVRIRSNPYIKGIHIDNTPILISMYADDTTLILDGSKDSLVNSIQELKSFENISGLKMNLNKTQTVWIGNKKYSDLCYPEFNLHWGENSFNLLGIDFHVDLFKIPKLNYDKKLVKLKSLMKAWNRRKLTPIGKIQLIKSLMISQFNHLFLSIPSPSENFIKKLNGDLYSFLWNGKTDKIKRDIVVKKYFEGGLNMLHLKNYIESLKITWVRRFYTTSSKWQKILGTQINENMLANCGTDLINKYQKDINNIFWKEVFQAWEKLVKIADLSENQYCTFAETPVWHNKNLTIDNSTIFYKHWYTNGIFQLSDLMKDVHNKTLYNLDEFKQRYKVKTNFLEYLGVSRIVQKYIAENNKPCEFPSYPSIPYNLKIIMKCKKGAKLYYNYLLNCRSYLVSSGRKKWEELFDFNNKIWNQIYNIPFQTTKESKLQWFQYRVNQHILTTNSYLYRAGVVDSPYCIRCRIEIETIEHALWECNIVQQFLHDFCTLLDSLYIPFAFNKETFIFGFFNNQHGLYNSVDNIILLITKQYIYRSRCLYQPLSVSGLKNLITDHYNSLKFNARGNNTNNFQIFQNEWNKWKTLVE